MQRETAPEEIRPRYLRLMELEKVIEEGLAAWVRTGQALMEIRDTQLYKETHPSFEEWAQDQFQLSRQRAYQLIWAVKTQGLLEERVEHPPLNESQVRPLTRLDADEAVTIWQKVVGETKGEITRQVVERAVREARRQAKVNELASIAAPELDTDTSYPIILADPPWRYMESTADPSRQIENQYQTMTLGDICDLPVRDLATPDAVLFLWATAPLLPEGLRVMDAWGFDYRSNAVWDKVHIGMGFWFRGQHEHLLVGVRGNPPKPSPRSRKPSVVQSQRGKHSAKPDAVYELIESYYPELPKIELFARGESRKNWSSWGNDVSP